MFAIAQVLVFVKIMLTVLVLDPRSFDAFSGAKSAASHSASLILAALLVWLLARHGRAILFWSPLHVGVGALLLSFAVATPFAVDPTIALFGAFKRYLGLTQMLDNGLLYLSVGILFRDARSLRLLAIVTLGVAIPVLGYALIQRLELDPLTFAQGSTRIPISTLGNPDMAGAFVAVVGTSALALAFLWMGLVGWVRTALLLLGIASVGVLYTTSVRAGVLAVIGGWLTTILVAMRMPQVGRRRVLAGVAIAVVFGLGVVFSPIGPRLAPDYLRTDTASLSRLDIWRAAAISVLERPVLGVGPDNFAAIYPSRRTQGSIRTGELQTSTHDIWLYVATSAGIVGLACFLLVVVLTVDRALRLGARGHPAAVALVPVMAYMSQGLVNVSDISVDWIFWVAVGAIAGSSGAPIAVPRRRSQFRSARAVGLAALAVAATIAVSAVAPRIGAGEAMLATEAYTSAGRAAVGVSYGETAVNADARRAEFWSSYGAALYGAGERAAAVQAFSNAAERQPWHPVSWKNLAVAWSALGNSVAAYEAAKRIPMSDPYDVEGRELLAALAYDRGDYVSAASHGAFAIALDPHATAYFTTVSAFVQLKDLERAEPLAREASTRFPTARFRLQLAAILADRGKTAEALSIADAVVLDFPEDPAARALRDALLKR